MIEKLSFNTFFALIDDASTHTHTKKKSSHKSESTDTGSLGYLQKRFGVGRSEEVKARIGNAIGPYEDLLTSVKKNTS